MIKKNSFPDIMTIIGFAVAALFLAFGLYILFSPPNGECPKRISHDFWNHRNFLRFVQISYHLSKK